MDILFNDSQEWCMFFTTVICLSRMVCYMSAQLLCTVICSLINKDILYSKQFCDKYGRTSECLNVQLIGEMKDNKILEWNNIASCIMDLKVSIQFW